MSALLRERMYAVVDRDFTPPMVVLMLSDPVYGLHAATLEYAGYGFTEPGAFGALNDVTEAAAVADALSNRWNMQRELVAELSKAHQIISVMLTAMTVRQKFQLGAELETRELSGEGTTRANEREAVLARAGAA